MRTLKTFAAAAALASLATAPVVAQAGTASKLSLRASTKAKKANGIKAPVIVGIVATAAIVTAAIVLASESP